MKRAISLVTLVVATLLVPSMLLPAAASPRRLDGIVRWFPDGDPIGEGWVTPTDKDKGLRGQITLPGAPWFQGPQTWILDTEYVGELPYMIFYLIDGPIQYVYSGVAKRKAGPEKLPCTIQATLYVLPNGSAAVGRNATITIGRSDAAGLVPYFEVFFDGNAQP